MNTVQSACIIPNFTLNMSTYNLVIQKASQNSDHLLLCVLLNQLLVTSRTKLSIIPLPILFSLPYLTLPYLWVTATIQAAVIVEAILILA